MPISGFAARLKTPLVATLVLVMMLVQVDAFAQDRRERGEALAQAYRCYSCHDLKDTLIGPPYQAIAARHASRKAVMDKVLAAKIINGGGGNWGLVPMVPNEHVPEEDALVIARWILSLAP